MQKIVTNLWFDDNAEEAVDYYCSLFEDSKIIQTVPYSEVGPGEPGKAMVIDFELAGQQFTAINGGGEFHYTHAMSLLVNCDSQEEVDRLWDALLAGGGREVECGWLNDRYGVPWQIWPSEANDLVGGPDPEAAQRAMKAMLGQRKINVQALRDAYEDR
ncbi:VOC family protein [Glycomyces tarimensis]